MAKTALARRGQPDGTDPGSPRPPGKTVETSRIIFCVACQRDILAELVTGATVYPSRQDLADLPFWQCPVCQNHVGCHKGRKAPLGCIPDLPMRRARQHIHAILDPIHERGFLGRSEIYEALTLTLGRTYHTADLRTLDEARTIWHAIMALRRRVGMPPPPKRV
jgi:hypothetical protein